MRYKKAKPFVTQAKRLTGKEMTSLIKRIRPYSEIKYLWQEPIGWYEIGGHGNQVFIGQNWWDVKEKLEKMLNMSIDKDVVKQASCAVCDITTISKT